MILRVPKSLQERVIPYYNAFGEQSKLTGQKARQTYTKAKQQTRPARTQIRSIYNELKQLAKEVPSLIKERLGDLLHQTPAGPILPPLHRTDPSDPIDGWFKCAECGDETSLMYRRGPYPFNPMQCMNQSCGTSRYGNTIISDRTEFSPVVRPYPSIHNPFDVPLIPEALLKANQVPYFIVCPRCGLPHRAKATKKSRDKLAEDKNRHVSSVDVGHVKRCSNCSLLKEDEIHGTWVGRERVAWLLFSIRFDRVYQMADANFDGYLARI
ncbi:hypothetical protein P280DRAFT_476430 [Massarina eburnea CBS 473.64]|uniref:Probable double zinc ribbon domain-containing protein n=1 Tax=Massarina eburnea CBS 473.64 TaxID=1395130 RepID=A0A6A6SDX7_9PLEO|nr:hypothetical protein P280DRAFT_476430 [Massarina eburnea CBS 473.64]